MGGKFWRIFAGRANYHAVGYAAMFLLCAFISALGAGLVAVLSFLPAVAAAEWMMQRLERRGAGPGRRG